MTPILPNRIAGHMSLEEFVKMWGKEIDSFNEDPPNATLSVFNKDENNDAVVEITDPHLKGDVLTFKVRLLSGSIEREFSACGLFLDSEPAPPSRPWW